MTKTAKTAKASTPETPAAASATKAKPQVDDVNAAKPNHSGHELYHDFRKLVLAAIQHHAHEGVGATKAEIIEWSELHHKSLCKLTDEQFGVLNVQTLLHQLFLEDPSPVTKQDVSPMTYSRNPTPEEKAAMAKAAEEHYPAFCKLIHAAIQHHANDGAGATKAEITDWCLKHHETLVHLTCEQFALLHLQSTLNKMSTGEGACIHKHESA
jgi:hypothetical protein